jgi:Ca2+-binding RTX toxin-like protein
MNRDHVFNVRARRASASPLDLIEPLEPRRLMAAVPSAAVVGDRLVIRGSDVADTITVVELLDEEGLNAISYAVKIQSSAAGGLTIAPVEETFPAGGIRRVVVATGAGDDQVEFSPPVPAVNPPSHSFVTLPSRVTLGAGDDTFNGGSNDDVVSGGAGADFIRGNGGRDLLGGGAGRDRISGGGGDDILTGNAGADELHGSAGNDTLLGGAGDDLLGALRQVTLEISEFQSDPGDDLLFGGAGDDDLLGGEGVDTLFGNAGRDSVSGGDGLDRLRGGTGPDRFYNIEADAERLDFTPGVDELRGPPDTSAAAGGGSFSSGGGGGTVSYGASFSYGAGFSVATG